MSTNKNNKSNEAALATKLAAGLQQHFAANSVLYIAKQSLSPAQVAAQLEQLATLRSGVDAAKAAFQGKLAEERAAAPALRAFYLAVVGFVRVAYEGAPQVLADFGLAPAKPRKQLTPEERAAAKAKNRATRAARGTVGKKKKLAIKGAVTGVVVTPVTASAPVGVAAGSGASAPSGATAPSAATASSAASTVATNGVVNGVAAHS
jgi:hypothetical protein